MQKETRLPSRTPCNLPKARHDLLWSGLMLGGRWHYFANKKHFLARSATQGHVKLAPTDLASVLGFFASLFFRSNALGLVAGRSGSTTGRIFLLLLPPVG